MYFEIARTAYKLGKVWFCLLTFGLSSYEEFGKKHITENETTSVTVEKKS